MTISEFYDNACTIAYKVARIKPTEVSALVSKYDGKILYRCKNAETTTDKHREAQTALDQFEQLLTAKKNANTLSASK